MANNQVVGNREFFGRAREPLAQWFKKGLWAQHTRPSSILRRATSFMDSRSFLGAPVKIFECVKVCLKVGLAGSFGAIYWLFAPTDWYIAISVPNF